MSDSIEDNNFEHTPVASSATISGYHIALIIVGGTIAVPGFLMATQVSQQAGFYPAVAGFVLGCLILATLGVFTGLTGTRSRLSTYLIMRHAFGSQGFKICALITASISLFWFAIIGNLFGSAMTSVFGMVFNIHVDPRICSVAGGLIMTGFAIYGINTLDRLARVVVPFMAALLLYGAYKALGTYDLALLSAPGTGSLSVGGAASVVIGAYSGGIVTLPDYTRFARGQKGAAFAIFFALGISFPIVMTITAIPTILSGEQDLINIMLFLGIGAGALIVLVFSTVSSNSLLLYSAGLGISACGDRLRFWKVTSAVGIGATIISTFDVVNIFVPYISLLAISVPSLCGIYVCDFFLIKRGSYISEDKENLANYNWPAFFAWFTGIVTGLLSLINDFGIFSVPALDSMLPAFLTYWILARLALKPLPVR